MGGLTLKSSSVFTWSLIYLKEKKIQKLCNCPKNCCAFPLTAFRLWWLISFLDSVTSPALSQTNKHNWFVVKMSKGSL